MKIIKLCIYLLFYIHILGCYMWIALEGSQGRRYYRDMYSNHYKSFYGDLYRDTDGNVIEANHDFYMHFGLQPTFKEDKWLRYTE